MIQREGEAPSELPLPLFQSKNKTKGSSDGASPSLDFFEMAQNAGLS